MKGAAVYFCIFLTHFLASGQENKKYLQFTPKLQCQYLCTIACLKYTVSHQLCDTYYMCA